MGQQRYPLSCLWLLHEATCPLHPGLTHQPLASERTGTASSDWKLLGASLLGHWLKLGPRLTLDVGCLLSGSRKLCLRQGR